MIETAWLIGYAILMATTAASICCLHRANKSLEAAMDAAGQWQMRYEQTDAMLNRIIGHTLAGKKVGLRNHVTGREVILVAAQSCLGAADAACETPTPQWVN